MNNQKIIYANLIYIVLTWILFILNKTSSCQFFQMQRIYSVLQCIIDRDRIIYHLVTIIVIWRCFDEKSSFDVIISVSLFQLITAITQLVENRKMHPLFCLRILLLLCVFIITHSYCIFLGWQQCTLIEFGFNLYVWLYNLFSTFRVLSIVIRYNDGRAIIFSLLGYKNGCRVMWVRDLNVAKQVLQNSSDKGSFIEEKLASPAWLPILSLESVNGETWKDLKSRFLIFQKYLPSAEKLSQVTHSILSNQDANVEIDAKQVVHITVACFVKWIFDRDWDPAWDFVCEASWEWRKEIAIKGKADGLLKRKTVDWIIDLINQSKYRELFGEEWSKPEYYSIILQPFIISPMINFSDIAVSSHMRPELPINELIHYYHPFPILERYVSNEFVICTGGGSPLVVKENTQVFIPLDQIGQYERFDPKVWSPFGFGPRKCSGTQYAIAFLTTFLTYYKNNPKFVPQKNHQYSGRHNDNLTFRESSYQLIVIVKLLFS